MQGQLRMIVQPDISNFEVTVSRAIIILSHD